MTAAMVCCKVHEKYIIPLLKTASECTLLAVSAQLLNILTSRVEILEKYYATGLPTSL